VPEDPSPGGLAPPSGRAGAPREALPGVDDGVGVQRHGIDALLDQPFTRHGTSSLHPLLQPDPAYWGFRDLTKEEAKAVDAEHLRRLRSGHLKPVPEAA
jgi:hypothetical protein